MGMFDKQKKKERAVAFVDFEYMTISFRKRFGIDPDITGWYRELTARFVMDDVYFFADFTNQAMKRNISEIRKITNNVIDTQNTASHHKKDYTDFFILDAIYRTALDRGGASNIILFSGDGHFSAAARFLREKCDKHVICYGIETTISGQLKSCVDECVEYPNYATLKRLYYPTLARTMQKRLAETKQYLTKQNVLSQAGEETNINPTYLHDSLEEMILDGYVKEKEEWISSRKRTQMLSVDWDRLKQDEIL